MIEGARQLPFNSDQLLAHGTLESQVHVTLSLHQLEIALLQEGLDLLRLLILLILVLDLRVQGLRDLACSSTGEGTQGDRSLGACRHCWRRTGGDADALAAGERKHGERWTSCT